MTEPSQRNSNFLSIRRRWFIAALILWLAIKLMSHCLDGRRYDNDAGALLLKSIALVDEGRFPLEGNPFYDFRHLRRSALENPVPEDATPAEKARIEEPLGYRDLGLGPFTNFLGAIPLLFSRDVRGQYYFITILCVLAVFVFFKASAALTREGRFPWIGAAAFMFPMFLTFHTEIRPSNVAFLPLFMALYFYFLVKSEKGESGALPWLWLMVGLCMQTHMSCFILIGTTLVATSPFRDRRRFLLTLFGLALVVASHSTVLFVQFAQDPGPIERLSRGITGWVDMRGGGRLFETYWKMFLILPLYAVLSFGAGSLVFGFLGIAKAKRLAAAYPQARRILVAGLFHFAASMTLLPLLSTFKLNAIQFEYFYSGLVFWALYSALYIHWKISGDVSNGPAHWRRSPLKVFAVLTCVSELFALLTVIRPSVYCRGFFQLEESMQIGKRVVELIEEGDMWDIQIWEVTLSDDSGTLRRQSKSRETFSSLCLYSDPLLRWRLSEDGQVIVAVVIVPSWMDTEQLRHHSRFWNVDVLDRVEMGCIDAIIARGNVPTPAAIKTTGRDFRFGSIGTY